MDILTLAFDVNRRWKAQCCQVRRCSRHTFEVQGGHTNMKYWPHPSLTAPTLVPPIIVGVQYVILVWSGGVASLVVGNCNKCRLSHPAADDAPPPVVAHPAGGRLFVRKTTLDNAKLVRIVDRSCAHPLRVTYNHRLKGLQRQIVVVAALRFLNNCHGRLRSHSPLVVSYDIHIHLTLISVG